MKFNVELDKGEIRKLLDKPHPFIIACKKIYHSINKSIKKIKFKKPLLNNKSVLILGLFILLTISLIWAINLSRSVAYSDGFSRGSNYCKQKQIHQTVLESEDLTLKEVGTSFLKKVIITLENNLHILFLVIAIAWILHGFGFKIL